MNRHRSTSRMLAALVVLVLIATVLPLGIIQVSTVQAVNPADKIEPALLSVLLDEGSTDCIVRFSEQADLSWAYGMSWEDRGAYVVRVLLEAADRSQRQARSYLDGRGLRHETFIVGNDLYIWQGDLAAVNALSDLREVASIRLARTYRLDPIISEDQKAVEATVAWGITDAKADLFWSTFGFQGDGIVVANIDTGVQYNHPALDQAYRCLGDPSSPACWFDPSDICPGDLPCDNNGHGSHTMGTMVADDDPSLTYIAGMAPNAQWIACKGCESSSCSEYALNACADWVVQPNGNPANRPHIVNNSWGGGGCDHWYLPKVNAWRAAGIFPAFSAGNSTGCGSLGSPGDYQESFGTTGHSSSRAHYFAQGPSCYGHEPYTKPNISAPAVNVCSTVPGDGWDCGYSGTSMASPHSAGAVALLWSCNPGMIGQMALTFEALQNTADAPDPPNPPCGAPPDGEGTYEDGYGYLNVLAAGQVYCIPPATPTPTWTPLPAVTPNSWVDLPILPKGIHLGPTATPTATPPAPTAPPCPALGNGDFELGPVVWTQYSQNGWDLILNGGWPGSVTPRSGVWAVWEGGDYDEVCYIEQQALVPLAAPYFRYWHWIASQDYCGYDFAYVLVNGTVVDYYDLCSDNNTGGWAIHVVDLTPYANQCVTVQIRVETDDSYNSNLFVDDVAFQSNPLGGTVIPLPFDPDTAAPRSARR